MLTKFIIKQYYSLTEDVLKMLILLFHLIFIHKEKNRTIPICHQCHSTILEKYVLISSHVRTEQCYLFLGNQIYENYAVSISA